MNYSVVLYLVDSWPKWNWGCPGGRQLDGDTSIEAFWNCLASLRRKTDGLDFSSTRFFSWLSVLGSRSVLVRSLFLRLHQAWLPKLVCLSFLFFWASDKLVFLLSNNFLSRRVDRSDGSFDSDFQRGTQREFEFIQVTWNNKRDFWVMADCKVGTSLMFWSLFEIGLRLWAGDEMFPRKHALSFTQRIRLCWSLT